MQQNLLVCIQPLISLSGIYFTKSLIRSTYFICNASSILFFYSDFYAPESTISSDLLSKGKITKIEHNLLLPVNTNWVRLFGNCRIKLGRT